MSSCPCRSKDDPPRPLEDLVRGVFLKIGEHGLLTEEAVAQLWKGAVGKRAAGHSRPVSLKASRLVVMVDGSAWFYDLSLRKKDVLEKIDRAVSGATQGKKRVKSIVFRIG